MDKLVILVFYFRMIYEFRLGICICMLELLTISYFVLETSDLYLL